MAINSKDFLISILPDSIDFDSEFELKENDLPICIRVNPNKITKRLSFPIVPWSEHGYYLPSNYNVTLDPLFHAGAYSLQNDVEMFIAQIFRPINTKPLKVLDLFAGDGNVSTHIISLLQRGSILVSNEQDKEIAQNLSENIIKWGKSNCVVTNNTFKEFDFLQGFFDVIVINAPCSNELHDNISLESITQNKNSQLEILQKVWNYLSPKGIIIYNTKALNTIENEDVISEFCNRNVAETLPVPVKAEWKFHENVQGGNFVYRFLPQHHNGIVKSLAVIHKMEGDYYKPPKRLCEPTINIIPEHARLHYSNLIKNYKSIVYEIDVEFIWAFSADYGKFLIEIFARCNVIHAGIPLIQLRGNKLNPLAGLACANSFNDTILPKIQVDVKTALTYFSGEALHIATTEKGWVQLVYNGISIGFVKNLGERINNSCPKNWRVSSEVNLQNATSIIE